MKPVNNIYTPLSYSDSAIASPMNTFSKDIQLVTNRELSASNTRLKRQPMVSFSFDETDSENSSENSSEEVLAKGKHIMNMFQSLQDEKTEESQWLARKRQMKMSLRKVIGLSLGLSALGGIGIMSYFHYRNLHSPTDRNTALNASFSALPPQMELMEIDYEVTAQQFTTSDPIGNILIESSDFSDQSLIRQWIEWSKRAPLDTREQRNTALDALRYCLEHRSESLNLDNLYLTALPDHLPDIKFLSLSNNQLTGLPKSLPSGLVTLNISNNQLTELPGNLPSNLKELDITNNTITNWSNNFPVRLEILYISHEQSLAMPSNIKLPPELKQWYIDYYPRFLSNGTDELN